MLPSRLPPSIKLLCITPEDDDVCLELELALDRNAAANSVHVRPQPPPKAGASVARKWLLKGLSERSLRKDEFNAVHHPHIMLISAWLLSALPTLALAASAKYDKYRSIAQRNGGLVSLDAAGYDELTAAPRDYSVSVVLTALGEAVKCGPCKILQPEYAQIAKQWSSAKKNDDEEHIFAYLDFEKGPEIFQRLGLQTAPTFQLFMPTEGPRATPKLGAEKIDFGRMGFQADAIANHLRGLAKLPSLQYSRPVDKAQVAKNVFSTVVGALTIWRLFPYIKVALVQRYIWAFLAISTILLMNSGYMWCQIRKPQYAQVGHGGAVSYIAGGYQNQLGAEVYIVSAIYGILGFSVYTLAYTVPKLRDPVRQRLAIYVWTGVLLAMASVLFRVFHTKQPGYPFRIF
ncbi:oligosaccharyl transferase subunit ost3/OST6 [Rhodotorula mucilaginosa]|uniref:Oligosaccharyl transferase subunit ost3/OST6 n=1 Tax=Rhodotorula mucilaginosa TaxID=5537 RepID=A0A9P6W7Q4_RHOMI|nr:oligosaccharyl transferase subunit ost3/OST6 [Rhodotorula mucilaginosa]